MGSHGRRVGGQGRSTTASEIIVRETMNLFIRVLRVARPEAGRYQSASARVRERVMMPPALGDGFAVGTAAAALAGVDEDEPAPVATGATGEDEQGASRHASAGATRAATRADRRSAGGAHARATGSAAGPATGPAAAALAMTTGCANGRQIAEAGTRVRRGKQDRSCSSVGRIVEAGGATMCNFTLTRWLTPA